MANMVPSEKITHRDISTVDALRPLRWLSGKESVCQRRRCNRHRFDPWVRKIPWRRKWRLTPVFLLEKSHGQRSLEGTIHGVTRDTIHGVTKSWRHGEAGRLVLLLHQCYFPQKFKKQKLTKTSSGSYKNFGTEG